MSDLVSLSTLGMCRTEMIKMCCLAPPSWMSFIQKMESSW